MGSDYEYPGLPKPFLNIFSSVVEKCDQVYGGLHTSREEHDSTDFLVFNLAWFLWRQLWVPNCGKARWIEPPTVTVGNTLVIATDCVSSIFSVSASLSLWYRVLIYGPGYSDAGDLWVQPSKGLGFQVYATTAAWARYF